MASIWFGDLGDCFINVPDDIIGEKAKKILGYKPYIQQMINFQIGEI